jgi:hypothetical protein
MRNIVLGGLAALAIGGAAGSASAMEAGTFQNRLNGATIGLPLGALPPPGLYTGLETVYLGMVGNSGASQGAATGGARLFLPAIAQAVPLLYVPGWNFLGANYAMSVVQAFYFANNCGVVANCSQGPFSTSANGTLGGNFVTANTTWNPITLSWNLGGGWFVSGAFNFMAPDGTRVPGTTNPDYWTFEPAFAIAYLANNWVIGLNFFYDINTRSNGICCAVPATNITNGNSLYGDLAALYKFGKWEVGPVGFFEVQTTADSGAGCNPVICGNYQEAAIGGLVGYDFGPVDLQVWVTGNFVGNNTPQSVGGINIWSRMGFRLWAPEAPKPLVAKN